MLTIWPISLKGTAKMNSKEYVAIGGQALIEGIMMKGPEGTAVSVRLPDGIIETEMKDFKSLRNKYKFFNIPVIRGVVAFVESMIQGYKVLMESAEKGFIEEPSDESAEKEESSPFVTVAGTIGAVVGALISLFLFMWAPSYLFDFINDKLTSGSLDSFRAVSEGFLRILIFVTYLLATSFMKDMKRVYMYHGAEHKTIFCFEHGKELTVENIRKEKRFHPRCGTSFIFVTVILSIIISSVVSMAFPVLTHNRLIWIAVKLLMMPIIMGIGFECIQLAGKHQNLFTKLLSTPGLLMQRITTKEPTDDMIEVAIAAVKAALTGKVEEDPKKLSKEETLGEFIKKGAESLCEEHPDVVQDIIDS